MFLAVLEKLLGSERPEYTDQLGDESSPAGLVVGAKSFSGVAVDANCL
jgi:hypothetical protein